MKTCKTPGLGCEPVHGLPCPGAEYWKNMSFRVIIEVVSKAVRLLELP